MDDQLHPASASQDVRIGRALSDWQDAVDRGESFDVDAVIARNPDIADELRRHFGMLRLLERRRSPSGNRHRGDITALSPTSYVGTELGPYRLVQFIGQGGMGFVFKAREERLHRDVAIKILRPELAHDSVAIERFRREATSVARLRHDNIVTLYAVGEESGIHFLVMEYVEGPTLTEFIRKHGPVTEEAAERIFEQLMRGVEAAHAAGLIHRDIKSSNILLEGDEQRVKITDFGLARMSDSQTRLTIRDGVMGTAEYMSPEQAAGEPDIDHRSDLYSAGIVLYEMLAGRTPFASPTPTAVLHRVLYEQPAAISGHAQLDRLAMALIEKRPEDRPGSAADVLAILAGDVRLSRLRWIARRRRRVSVALLLIAVSIIGVRLLGDRFGATSRDASPPRIDRVWVTYDDPSLATTLMTRDAGSTESRVLYEFSSEADQLYCVATARIGANAQPIAIAGLKRPVEGDCVWAIDAGGRPLWHWGITSPITWPDCNRPVAYTCMALTAGDLDGRPGDEIVAAISDVDEYATALCVIDPVTQRITSTFWHMGHINQVEIADGFLEDGRPAIVARAFNNKLDGFGLPTPSRPYVSEYEEDAPRTDYDVVSVMMVLDPQSMDGYGPPFTSRITAFKPCRPVAYAYLDMAYTRSVLVAGQAAEDPAVTGERRQFDDLGCVTAAFVLDENEYAAARLRLAVDATDLHGELVGRVMLFTDERLNLVAVTPVNVGGAQTGSDIAYWQQYWRVLDWND